MLNSKLEKVLIIDGKDQHLDEENALVIHPKKLSLAAAFEKGTFDKAIIQNSPAEDLKAIGFFNISQALKSGGILEVYVDQPIVVMQKLDQGEIEANAKLGGFTDIKAKPFESWVKQNGNDIKIQTIKLTMVKADKK